jgi:hypothetical protein
MTLDRFIAALRAATAMQNGDGAETGQFKIQFGRLLESALTSCEGGALEHFDEFWKLYPSKVSKDAARKAWVRMDGDQYFEAIVKNIQYRLRTNEWNPLDLDRRRFIPHASTFLHQRRWQDPQATPTGAYREF